MTFHCKKDIENKDNKAVFRKRNKRRSLYLCTKEKETARENITEAFLVTYKKTMYITKKTKHGNNKVFVKKRTRVNGKLL